MAGHSDIDTICEIAAAIANKRVIAPFDDAHSTMLPMAALMLYRLQPRPDGIDAQATATVTVAGVVVGLMRWDTSGCNRTA
jgi:hypothetical protein